MGGLYWISNTVPVFKIKKGGDGVIELDEIKIILNESFAALIELRDSL